MALLGPPVSQDWPGRCDLQQKGKVTLRRSAGNEPTSEGSKQGWANNLQVQAIAPSNGPWFQPLQQRAKVLSAAAPGHFGLPGCKTLIQFLFFTHCRG